LIRFASPGDGVEPFFDSIQICGVTVWQVELVKFLVESVEERSVALIGAVNLHVDDIFM
jgi:hypothetical protein